MGAVGATGTKRKQHDMGFTTNNKANEDKITTVVNVPRKQVDLLNIYIPAYATEVPDELAELMWQIHRQINI